jgi:hypothetical protein
VTSVTRPSVSDGYNDAKTAPGGEHIFDATAQHPEWLGEEPERLQKLMPA